MIIVNHPYLNLVLKPLSLDDDKQLLTLIEANRHYLKQHLGWLDQTKTTGDVQQFIKHCMDGYKNQSSLILGLFEQNMICGIVGFHSLDPQHSAKRIDLDQNRIGYWLSRDKQGHGRVSTALRDLISYAIKTYPLEKLTIRVGANNHASQKVPERLGFRKIGRIPAGEILYGKPVDLLVYQCHTQDWSDNN